MDETEKWVNLDGECHVMGRSNECCSILRKRCRCGAWMHGQPVYGGIAEICEACPKDAEDWEAGPPPTAPGNQVPLERR